MDINHMGAGSAHTPGTGARAPGAPTDLARLRATAVKLEAQFLSEMLKHAGFDGTESGFSGGAGEAQFGSFLRDAQAMRMAQTGGIGLAETIFKSLQKRSS